MPCGLWDHSNSATTGAERLEREGRRKIEAWQWLGVGIEMWQAARLSIHSDEKGSLSLAGAALRAGDDGNEPAAILELGQQGFWDLWHAAVEENHVEGTGLGSAVCVIAVDHRRIVEPEGLKGLARRGGKLRLGLDRGHRPREMGKDCRRIACGAANIEHSILRLDRGKLGEPRKHDWRKEIARWTAVERGPDLERCVAIGEIALFSAGTKSSRGSEAKAVRMRRSVTLSVRSCNSTMVARAASKSIIAPPRIPETSTISGPGQLQSLIDAHANRHLVTGLGHPLDWPRGGVVTQRTANPCTPVQFRAWPPPLNAHHHSTFVPAGSFAGEPLPFEAPSPFLRSRCHHTAS